MKLRSPLLLVTATCLTIQIQAQQTIGQVRNYRQANEQKIMAEYLEFLAIPNVTSDTVNIRRNIDFIKGMMESRGIEVKLLGGRTPGVNKAVMGKVTVPGATQTIGFYAHYDGQPVNPKQWAPGLEPFKPVFLTAAIENGGKIISDYRPGQPIQPNWRLSGRGSADDKAGVMTILNAYEALVKNKTKLKHNLIFLFEGEEEEGSTHLDEIFEEHTQELKADCWIISDGPRHVSGKKSVVFGVRGDVNVSLTVYGPKRPLHSGNYGNWAPNPARMLVELLAGMKDASGRVLINGFYDDVIPLTVLEKEALANIPDIEQTLKKELGIVEPEGGGLPFLELLNQPTLNINGIASANVGAMASNIIPAKAEAVLDLRLVLGNDAERQVKKLTDHIRSKGYHILDHEPTDAERATYPKLIRVSDGTGYNAQRTPMNLPIARQVVKAVQSTTTDKVVLLPSAGGSLPLYMFETILGAKVVTVPVVNYDNNQHAENENVQISFLWEGIETMAALMLM
ncbi:M20/M25/M40 family metallo-hydrolase [Flavihumibacter stibioxidans]|uniref:Peptidase M20 n=1 Tax=Flavihumibacter stibioxidans TaxID=1834163 RepID=A0ABR7M797_9BACT|nr:M20/M25/M40 family metallo-hydrolase [Flavihumibacter stibioxidans]MBC6490890.1 peptidase M20 [Flavihumibacter stibioxidans]